MNGLYFVASRANGRSLRSCNYIIDAILANMYKHENKETKDMIGKTVLTFKDYVKADIENTNIAPKIKEVIFNPPATIVFWTDGTKTVVKAGEGEFDSEKGLAMAISKRMLGNKGNYYNEFKKWLPEKEKTVGELTAETFDNFAKAVKNVNKASRQISKIFSKHNK